VRGALSRSGCGCNDVLLEGDCASDHVVYSIVGRRDLQRLDGS
jgi:hypothetical protein